MTARGIDAQILDMLWTVADEADYQADGLLSEDSELRLGQFKVLDAVVSEPGFVGTDSIARTLRCSKANLGPMLIRLVEDERLECKRVAGRPRRLVYNETVQGFTTWEACEAVIRRYAGRLLASLSDVERTKLHALLVKIKDSKL